MATAWLSLGANIGNPPVQLREAIARIESYEAITVTAQSAILHTKPWGKLDQPDFTNIAIAIQTWLLPLNLLDALQDIERKMGRIRETVWGPRLIDIDIIAYEQLILNNRRLTLPHKYAHARSFVLDPLREIAPDICDWLIARNTPPSLHHTRENGDGS